MFGGMLPSLSDPNHEIVGCMTYIILCIYIYIIVCRCVYIYIYVGIYILLLSYIILYPHVKLSQVMEDQSSPWLSILNWS